MRTQSKVVVGYDLGNFTSQISYSYVSEDNPITLSCVPDKQVYNIPTQLGKRLGVNQWFHGEEANRLAYQGEVVLVDNLLRCAIGNEVINIENVDYQAKDLLALFMKKSFELIKSVAAYEHIALLVITIDELNQTTIPLLEQITSDLPIRQQCIVYQTREDAFFHYTTHMPKSIWEQQVVLVDSSEQYVRIFRLEMQKNQSPIIAFVDKIQCDTFSLRKLPDIEGAEQVFYEKSDAELLWHLRKVIDYHQVTTVYFIGDVFVEEHFSQTLGYTCKKQRVFLGNNLFSKGACYLAKDMLMGTTLEDRHIFLGNDKLKSTIAVNAFAKGKEVLVPLLSAGTNWYEAETEVDFLMDEEQSMEILVSHITSEESFVVKMELDGMPKRPKRATRIRLRAQMLTEIMCRVEVSDLGFGEIFKQTGLSWTKEIEIRR